MERDFHRFLLSLAAGERQEVLTTFLHLMDDGELSDLLTLAQSEQSNRSKRAERSSAKRQQPEDTVRTDETPAQCARNRYGLKPFKKVRMAPITSTPMRMALVTPLRSQTPVRLQTAVSQPKDLLSSLVDGQPEVEAEDTVTQPADELMTDQMTAEEEEFLMNSEDDAIASLAYGNYEDKQKQRDAAAASEQAAGDSDLTPDRQCAAVGQFVTARFRKIDVKQYDKVEKLFEQN